MNKTLIPVWYRDGSQYNLKRSLVQAKAQAGDVFCAPKPGIDWDILDVLEHSGQITNLLYGDTVVFTVTEKFNLPVKI